MKGLAGLVCILCAVTCCKVNVPAQMPALIAAGVLVSDQGDCIVLSSELPCQDVGTTLREARVPTDRPILVRDSSQTQPDSVLKAVASLQSEHYSVTFIGPEPRKDPCVLSAAQLVSLELKSTRIGADGDVTGIFEISAANPGRTVVLPGRRRDGDFLIEYPEVALQYEDSNSKWTAVGELAGTFVSPPDKLRLRPHSSEVFSTDLMSSEAVNQKSQIYRIIVWPLPPGTCIASQSFRAIYVGAKLTGFK